MSQEIQRIQAVDEEGCVHVILLITPIETIPTYHGVRTERGRVRHELADGTAVVPLSDEQFRVEPTGMILELVR